MSNQPPERPNGQDEPPDVRTAVVAVLLFLGDVADYVDAQFPDEATRDLRERIGAHRRALRRLRARLEAET